MKCIAIDEVYAPHSEAKVIYLAYNIRLAE